MQKSLINIMDSKHSTISLIANSGIQCLDYLVDTSEIKKIKDLRFNDCDDISDFQYLKLVEDENNNEPVPIDERQYRSTIDSSIVLTADQNEEMHKGSVAKALEAFDRQWIPVPYFSGEVNSSSLQEGPSNWARIYLAAPESDGDTYQIIIGFDTELCEKINNRPYAGPVDEDTRPTVRFQLVKDIETLCRFAQGPWQHQWINECYPKKEDKKRNIKIESLAHYVALIHALPEFTVTPTVKLIKAKETLGADKISSKDEKRFFVDVDLVLDIGNSRTCGLLAEFGPSQESIGLGAQPPALLRMRELSRPELVSEDPFESRVEFNPANFGLSIYGKQALRSTRKDAFWWPSPVRVGNEAAWLTTKSEGRRGVSGMSSPKRYVWDDAKRPRPWTNNESAIGSDGRIQRIVGPIPEQLSEDGKRRKPGEISLEVSYCRGAMYKLLIAEIVCHALSQINSPAYRYERSDTDLPRRLRKIILTLPSATPLAERNTMQRHAKEAIELVWRSYGWPIPRDQKERDPLHPMPKLHFDWDEATCTQLVFLYNELEHRFQEFPKAFFSLYGSGRKAAHGDVLRVASIDIGGGTTDLMIIDHELSDQLIIPNQLFREGIRVAGDDILKDIIQKIILPCIVSSLSSFGDKHADRTVSNLFGGDRANINSETQARRALFVNQVLAPAALKLLSEYEKAPSGYSDVLMDFTFADVVDKSKISDSILNYIVPQQTDNEASEIFDPLSVKVSMSPRQLAGSAESVIGGALRDFCDVIRAYNCDLLLISGRPVAMPAIRDIILAATALAPDRIISMYGYEVGNWYPYRSKDSRIWDPKTTTSVGAMLCHLCEGDYAHFAFESSNIKPKSTARYIGRMSGKGQIAKEDVYFENQSADDNYVPEFSANFTVNLDIGFRQLPYERWSTSQLYRAQFVSADSIRDDQGNVIPRPITLNIIGKDASELSEDEDLGQELSKEKGFEVESVKDRNGNPVDEEKISLKLQTFFEPQNQVDAGYWLDSGVLSTKDLIEGDTHESR